MSVFRIEDQIFELFPDTHIGVVIAKGIDNSQGGLVEARLRESEKQAQEKYAEVPLLEIGELQAWRDAFKVFGAKKGRRVSIEALMKRVVKGNTLPLINPLVDIYNAISLTYALPCGGEDLDTMNGDLRLALAVGDESFRTIGSDIDEPPSPGEVVYKDDEGCVCRCWNWREADRTKLTEHTKNAILVVETLDKSNASELESALNELAQCVRNELGADTHIAILHQGNSEVEL